MGGRRESQTKVGLESHRPRLSAGASANHTELNLVLPATASRTLSFTGIAPAAAGARHLAACPPLGPGSLGHAGLGPGSFRVWKERDTGEREGEWEGRCSLSLILSLVLFLSLNLSLSRSRCAGGTLLPFS